ncbi:MAG TPA: MGMT family protein [Gaiellales bacterium]|jgi:methylated-DNA-protein-cysteine methyltransferase related protein|nr:MGMT family protein [Gaiellales bacterium]
MRIPPGFRIVTEASAFERSVAEMVRRVPAGKVASYGRIAAWLGQPAAARAVGGAMARSPDGVPAHRVVTSVGRLAPGWEREQAELLRVEGVRVWRGHVREPIPWWDGPQRRTRRSTRPGRSSG